MSALYTTRALLLTGEAFPAPTRSPQTAKADFDSLVAAGAVVVVTTRLMDGETDSAVYASTGLSQLPMPAPPAPAVPEPPPADDPNPYPPTTDEASANVVKKASEA